MEIKVSDTKENPLLSRKEIRFVVNHPRVATPKILDIKEKLAATLSKKEELVFIDTIKPEYGKPSSLGYAKIYDTVDSAKDIEKKHIIKMNEGEVKKDEEAS